MRVGGWTDQGCRPDRRASRRHRPSRAWRSPTGAGSRGIRRVPLSSGVAVAHDRGDRHLNNHTDAANRAHFDARSTREARRHPLSGRSSGRAIRPSRGHSSTVQFAGRRSVPRGRWRDRLGPSGSSLTASGSSRFGASLVRVADVRPRRNGGDVHRRTTLSRRRARPPVFIDAMRAGPGRSSPIDWRQRAALPSPAWSAFRAAPRNQGGFPCRQWKRPMRRPR